MMRARMLVSVLAAILCLNGCGKSPTDMSAPETESRTGGFMGSGD